MLVSLLLRRSWQTFLGYWHQTFPSMEMHKHRIPASLALQHRYGRTADPSAVGVGANMCFQTQSKYVFSCFSLCIFRIKIFLLGSVMEKWTSYASVQKAQLREYSRCFGSFSVQLYCFSPYRSHSEKAVRCRIFFIYLVGFVKFILQAVLQLWGLV